MLYACVSVGQCHNHMVASSWITTIIARIINIYYIALHYYYHLLSEWGDDDEDDDKWI